MIEDCGIFESASLSQRICTGSLLIHVFNRVSFHFDHDLIMLFIYFIYRKVKTRWRRRGKFIGGLITGGEDNERLRITSNHKDSSCGEK